MRITLLALGTRGDVQPLVALGVGLQQTGRHQARVVAPDEFDAFVSSQGLDFVPVGINVRELLGTVSLTARVESGGNMLLWVRQILYTLQPMFERMMGNLWSACQGAEAIVCSTMGIGAYHVAEKLGVPCYWTLPFPGLARTRAFPNVVFPSLPLGGAYNLVTHILAEQLMQQLTGRFLNQWRRRVNLPSISLFRWPYNQLHGQPVPILYSFSPLLIPKPPDWGENIHITGYWFLDHRPDWQPPAGLMDFLAAGSPPVYVGFGSLAQRNPRRMTHLVLEALKQSGQRGVLVTGWGGLLDIADLSHLPREAFTLESVPHDWLFPRMAAVVHHGGSGTTGAGLRSGVPSVLVPHAGDQPLWARRVWELGAGPRPIPRRQLTAERLADAIAEAVKDRDLRARAAELGERIRAEDGVRRAVEIVECGAAFTPPTCPP